MLMVVTLNVTGYDSERFLVLDRLVVPWEEDELKRLLHAVKSSDIPKVAA